jgi:L-threonylcarbamoyladenylate synthase
LEAALGRDIPVGGNESRPVSPGQLASHYAPQAQVRLNAPLARQGEIMVGFGPVAGAMSLSKDGDLVQAAAALFHVMRMADQMAGKDGRIAFAPIPEIGLGRAINDRLRRAAAPRG